MTTRTYARATAAERAERIRKVLQLRLRAGLPISEIAVALDMEAKKYFGPDARGPSKRTVQRDLRRGLEAMRDDQPSLADLKTELDGFLGELLRSHLPRALGSPETQSEAAVAPDPTATKLVLEILDRQAALHGLNAPDRMEVVQRVIAPDLADQESGWDKAPPVTQYDPDKIDTAHTDNI